MGYKNVTDQMYFLFRIFTIVLAWNDQINLDW